MCGIAGIWNLPNDALSLQRVESMLDAMRRRGPDGRGTTTFAGGATGMVRLALVGTTPDGDQPMWSPCGRIAIVFNGEIYNFREEKRRLEALGHAFRTQTDTEVLLHLFIEDSNEFMHRLRGMYAAAIFDWRDRSRDDEPTVTLIRGPFGVKPLYVAEVGPQGRTLVFASELRGILASGLVERNIDSAALSDYLHHGFVLQPRTMIRGVRMLEAGTCERFTPNRPTKTIRYWHMPPAEPRVETFAESAERLRHELNESIRLHALADAPVGAFLSGGVDSTCIVAMMREHVADLHTYSLQFPEEAGADESDAAAETARTFDCRHTVIPVTGTETARLLPQFAADLDQPSIDGLNTWVTSRGVCGSVKGVLSGLGGDEWFAGYPVAGRMQEVGRSGFYNRMRSFAGEAAWRLTDWAPTTGIARRLAGVASWRSWESLWLYVHTLFPLQQSRRLAGILTPIAGHHEIMQLQRRYGINAETETPLGLACVLDVYVYMMCQLLRDSDALSMASSLELRVPFVDVRIAEFSRSCRDEFKRDNYSGSPGKRVLVEAVRDLLPQGIQNRPKRGFTLPVSKWMGREFLPLTDEICRPEVFRHRGLLDPQGLQPLLATPVAQRTPDQQTQLWSLLILELWLRATMDVSPKFPHLASV